MREEPLAVGRVAVEAAAEVILDSAALEGVEGELEDPLQLCVSPFRDRRREDAQRAVRRKLWRAAETSEGRVEGATQLVEVPIEVEATERLGVLRRVGDSPAGEEIDHRLADAIPLLFDLFALLGPEAIEVLDQRREAGASRHVLGREVGPGVPRLAVGGQPHRVRPTAVPGHQLRHLHVDLVDVGAFFPIDLHADESAVEELGDAGTLEGLPLHHVTPVAGRVADGEEDRSIELASARERLVPPRVPVDRVAGVLAEVGTRLENQAVELVPSVVGESVDLFGGRERLVRHGILSGERIMRAPPVRRYRIVPAVAGRSAAIASSENSGFSRQRTASPGFSEKFASGAQTRTPPAEIAKSGRSPSCDSRHF